MHQQQIQNTAAAAAAAAAAVAVSECLTVHHTDLHYLKFTLQPQLICDKYFSK